MFEIFVFLIVEEDDFVVLYEVEGCFCELFVFDEWSKEVFGLFFDCFGIELGLYGICWIDFGGCFEVNLSEGCRS